jgi:hypothetical protein
MKFFDKNGVELKQKIDRELLKVALPQEIIAEGEHNDFFWVAVRGDTDESWYIKTTTNKHWSSDRIAEDGEVLKDELAIRDILDVTDEALTIYKLYNY